MSPTERNPTPYFWTMIDPGRDRRRLADGTYAVRDYRQGETRFPRNAPGNALIHDLENVGTTLLRFVTVERLDDVAA